MQTRGVLLLDRVNGEVGAVRRELRTEDNAFGFWEDNKNAKREGRLT